MKTTDTDTDTDTTIDTPGVRLDRTFTVAFRGSEWSFFEDGTVPLDWEIWQTGLTWSEAHDLV